MAEMRGEGRATLVRNDIEFGERDVRLLRAIGETGSVAKAASVLGRSRARDLSRIDELESAFGDLVERHRGGTDGGGSRLTENAVQLLNQYERLQLALSATARVSETVLDGTVDTVTGELADVATECGTICGLHDAVEPGDSVQIRIGADAVTLLDPTATPDPDSTSARNQFSGTIDGIDPGETVSTVRIEVGGSTFRALVTKNSATRLSLVDGREVVVTWKATATWVAHEM